MPVNTGGRDQYNQPPRRRGGQDPLSAVRGPLRAVGSFFGSAGRAPAQSVRNQSNPYGSRSVPRSQGGSPPPGDPLAAIGRAVAPPPRPSYERMADPYGMRTQGRPSPAFGGSSGQPAPRQGAYGPLPLASAPSRSSSVAAATPAPRPVGGARPGGRAFTGTAAAIGGGTAVMRTPAGSAQNEALTTMAQNAGMPPLHTIEPLKTANPYSRVDAAAQGRMAEQFSAPGDFGVQPLQPDPAASASYQQAFKSTPVDPTRNFRSDYLTDARAIPMDDNLYQNLSQAAQGRVLTQFQAPDDFGVPGTTPNTDPTVQANMREAFRRAPTRVATVDAFGGADARPAQGSVKAPVAGGLDLSQIKDPGMRAWAEHHANSPRSVIDNENIVTRYLKKQGMMSSQAESPATSGNTPEAEALMQQSFTTGSPDVYATRGPAPQVQIPSGAFSAAPKVDWQTASAMPADTVAPSGAQLSFGESTGAAQGDSSFADAFKRRNNRLIAEAFGGSFSPGMERAMGYARNAGISW